MTVHPLPAAVAGPYGGARLSGVRKILVLRPNALGDFIFALPALHALRAAYPQAHIVYLGQPWHVAFLNGRPGPLDAVRALPPVPGVGAPADAVADAGAIAAFKDAVRAERFDLALQMYGGGRYSNPFLKELGARHCAGLKAPDAEPLERWLYYTPLQNERLRLLELVALVGAEAASPTPRFTVTDADHDEVNQRIGRIAAPLVVLQPGARDPRRRWPQQRFAALGDALAGRGYAVAVHGSPAERDLVQQVCAAMQHPALDLGGRLSLGGLTGLLAQARLLVSNDTGPLHLADALGTPTVGVFWFTNAFVSAPLQARWHRQAISLRTHCPECGADNRSRRCGHDPSFVADVPLAEVLALADELLERPPAPALPAAGGQPVSASC